MNSDLAYLYNVETKVSNQAVKRNLNRFPEYFCFQLTKEEYENLRSQFVTSSEDNIHGGRRYMPYVFTEQGVAMLLDMFIQFRNTYFINIVKLI